MGMVHSRRFSGKGSEHTASGGEGRRTRNGAGQTTHAWFEVRMGGVARWAPGSRRLHRSGAGVCVGGSWGAVRVGQWEADGGWEEGNDPPVQSAIRACVPETLLDVPPACAAAAASGPQSSTRHSPSTARRSGPSRCGQPPPAAPPPRAQPGRKIILESIIPSFHSLHSGVTG